MAIYSVEMFGRMFADRVRHDAYDRAIRQSVREGDVVLDIGTGIGVYAMLAAKLGARRVYAVEVNPYVRLGRELADANGWSDRVEFIQALSTEIDLPEPANVIISDLRGVLPYYGQHLASIRDAKSRHLAPGGILMPSRDRIFAAIASNPRGVRHYRDIWLDNPFGLDLSRVAREDANTMRKDRLKPEDLITDPIEVAQIDYGSSLTETGFGYTGSATTVREGTAHGLSVWFEASVLEGITYNTGPFAPETIYGMAFFPFSEAVELKAGTEVSFGLSARSGGEDYIWSWQASASDHHGSSWTIDQCSLRSAPLDIERIKRRKASYRPRKSPAMDMDLLVLRLLADGHTLGEVATSLMAAHPDMVGDMPSALTHVADLAEGY
jgi:protein arginine N-methyltransferase 1